MSVAETPALTRPNWVVRQFKLLVDIIIGGFLCLTPLTSLIALGWLTRRMEAQIDARWERAHADPGWIFGQGRGPLWLVSGLASNIRMGFRTFAGLAIWSAPFTILWLGSWWAGWENSFNKGYEQAFVGPLVGMTGVLLALLTLVHLPFALAHFASEQRFGAFFELRRIRSVTKSAGWRVPWIAVWTGILSIPLFGMRALPVFVEDLIPGFADMGPDAQEQVIFGTALFTAVWAFFSLALLRGMAAKAYAVAAPRAAAGQDAALWEGQRAAAVQPTRSERRRLLWPFWQSLAAAAYFGLVAQIFVGQFMNHSWALWVTHPAFLLPWAG